MKLILMLIFSIALTTSKPTFASHFAGGELTYTCLGGSNYKVTLIIYQDCAGVDVASSLTVAASCSSDTAANFTINLPKINGGGTLLEISCFGYSKCDIGNYYGIRKHIYEANAVLTPCDNWIISHTNSSRNAVSTVWDNNYNGYFIFAKLDNLHAPCNNSPKFTNNIIPIIFCNNSTFMNSGLVDADGDSLSVSLVGPKTINESSSVVFHYPYSATSFLSSTNGITLNTSNGNMYFTPNLSLIAPYCLEVKEWRKINGTYQLIGKTLRDSQVFVDASSSNFPDISGVNMQLSTVYSKFDTITFLNECAGNKVEFTINGKDSNYTANNSYQYSLEWDNSIYGANFSAYYNGTDSAYAHFVWQPDSSSINAIPHCFYVKITDRDCPYYKSTTKKYCIKVNPPMNPPIIGSDTTICINHTLLLDAGPADSYLWFNGDTTQTTLVDASTLGVGNHQVGVTISTNGCSATDSFNLTVDACAGLNMAKECFDFQINPNPGNGIFNITFKQNMISTTNIEVLNAFGQLIMKKENIKTDRNSFQIDLSNLEKGVYFIKIYEIQGFYPITKRVVIQ